MSEHPSTDDLRAFSAGTLPREQSAAIEEHLKSCMPCTSALEEVLDCRNSFARRVDTTVNGVSSNTTSPAAAEGDSDSERRPEQIGPYPIERELGRGGFGVVYLGRDEQLQRSVAIKVPHKDRVSRPKDVEQYLTEARTVAHLKHPHIVRVHHVGSTEAFPFYVVSEYVDGANLAENITQSRLSYTAAAELVATVADALHHAHKQRLVHRDVKPGNILVDRDGTPYITDFGLALREADLGKGPRYAGTPGYMSPEQARGEGHRVDGRSDIYSLGAVFYELLTGRRTFVAEVRAELLQLIAEQEVGPPRMLDDRIPKELERICLKALSRRATDRYTTAKDMADDLRQFAAAHRDPLHGNPATRSSSVLVGSGQEVELSIAETSAGLLHAMWDALDPALQDAFSLAYNKKRRLGKNRISTRDLFQALVRIQDDALASLIHSLPTGAMPGPIDADLSPDERVVEESPLLSDCVRDSLLAFRKAPELPRKLSAADLLVDIGKHGHGPSVRRLRDHGVTADDLESRVVQLNLSIVHRPTD